MIQEPPTTTFTLCNFSISFLVQWKAHTFKHQYLSQEVSSEEGPSLTDLRGANKILQEPHKLIWQPNPEKAHNIFNNNKLQISNHETNKQPSNQLQLLSTTAPIEDQILIPIINLEEASLFKQYLQGLLLNQSWLKSFYISKTTTVNSIPLIFPLGKVV